MEKLKVEYMNKSGLCLIRIRDNVFYYGDGSSINAYGISANQFLRFNPYLDYVADKNVDIPEAILEYLEKTKYGLEQ